VLSNKSTLLLITISLFWDYSRDYTVSINQHCIGGVMVSVLSSSAVDRGFQPRSAQTKDYKIGICCFSC
jgi:hypothetical protein